jgi:hypothetical protein
MSLPPLGTDRTCLYFGNGRIQQLASFLGQPRAGELLDCKHLHQKSVELAAGVELYPLPDALLGASVRGSQCDGLPVRPRVPPH